MIENLGRWLIWYDCQSVLTTDAEPIFRLPWPVSRLFENRANETPIGNGQALQRPKARISDPVSVLGS